MTSDDYGSYVNGSCPPDYEIDPDDTDSFEFMLAADLDGDTIDTVTWVLPDGLTEVSSSNTDTTATIFVSGAECGVTYRITCRYTTDGGRQRDKTIRVIGRSH
jgi:hypothetical protein